MTDSKAFIDTNILVYAADGSDIVKRDTARGLIAELTDSGRAVISTQVMQEFFNVAVKKLQMSKNAALEILKTLYTVETISTTRETVLQAIDFSINYQYSIWDSLILAAAIDAGCRIVYSEDLNDGQIIEGVEIKNPFQE